MWTSGFFSAHKIWSLYGTFSLKGAYFTIRVIQAFIKRNDKLLVICCTRIMYKTFLRKIIRWIQLYCTLLDQRAQLPSSSWLTLGKNGTLLHFSLDPIPVHTDINIKRKEEGFWYKSILASGCLCTCICKNYVHHKPNHSQTLLPWTSKIKGFPTLSTLQPNIIQHYTDSNKHKVPSYVDPDACFSENLERPTSSSCGSLSFSSSGNWHKHWLWIPISPYSTECCSDVPARCLSSWGVSFPAPFRATALLGSMPFSSRPSSIIHLISPAAH